MPRLSTGPRRSMSKGPAVPSPLKSPGLKIPLNDDAQEKEQRSRGRKALHEAQINQLKLAATAVATPARSVIDENGTPTSNGPRTPRRRISGKENFSILDDDDRPVVGGAVVTPMKRVPILANFEEWMKMATDNKINAANSWNFALIDYFHDMSLLKEGDGVNFQKASCTLDGCVKIYTSRVDSVATETGKLLSGLADSRDSKKRDRGEGEDGGDDDEEEDEVDENGNVLKKRRKKTQRSSEATLAPSFASLQLKKFELEFSVDPLFKKASADFDEGGAKGLLLNHLMIDSQGRIVFDSSDDAIDTLDSRNQKAAEENDQDADPDAMDIDAMEIDGQTEKTQTRTQQQEEEEEDDVEIDIASLGARFFPDLGRLDEMDVCPSLKTFILGDPSGSLDIPFLRAPEDWRQEQDRAKTPGLGNKSGFIIDDENPLGFDDDDALGAFDLGGDVDVAFGEGGEAWAREAAIEPQMMRVFDAGLDIGEGEGGDDGDGVDGDLEMIDQDKGDFGMVNMTNAQKTDRLHEDILSYFDQALSKNWTSAEHWRIRKIKDVNKPQTGEPQRQRKEKQAFEIDFFTPVDRTLHDVLHTQATTNSAISLPKKDWKSKSRNLLPDDKHFSSKQLLNLFLKPKARLGRKQRAFGRSNADNQNPDQVPEGTMDEAFWAQQKAPLNQGPSSQDDHLPQGDYDANFFQDDGLPFANGGDDDDDEDMDEEVFADARDHFSPGPGGTQGDGAAGKEGTAGLTMDVGMTGAFNGLTVTNPADLAFGTMLVTQSRRVRPEYVQYARRAKKVDIPTTTTTTTTNPEDSLLSPPPTTTPSAQPPSSSVEPPKEGEEEQQEKPTLKFTEVMNSLQKVYPKQAMDDISTSYCFICLLHLANEKGLVIEKSEELTELYIKKDANAVVEEGGE
ncbi:barren-domain-containing protein [Neurospora crassa]|uniref:Condensin complex subunit 2 n=1 Tax=Neurospora crassa (strain ATCC 24698 / 74-OR23-1A / CBS 708.71 / DSM 1257 / FGSC 987) TaxID=367110 RepID=Q7SCS0_NEUCR|nr:condensin complex component cnd2 [Neurospora crassa OR74A]EAA34549.3 condensin complex component cnd2 [Neurospora crassa OR74A]KHE81939.1 barren-domain-containing protein [Neurospora crassa]|eukprot:XP_963785.3 condensin complex component cnd2 [Neurospora crassa OR74A]